MEVATAMALPQVAEDTIRWQQVTCLLQIWHYTFIKGIDFQFWSRKLILKIQENE